MASYPEDFLSDILGNVTSVLNFEEWKHSRLQFENIGQNYFGDLVPLELTGKIDGREARVRLVLKLAPTDEKRRVSGAVTLMFHREIFVYITLISEYRVTQQRLNLTPYVVPTCYYVCREYCREAVVLQDMTAEGYAPYTHKMFLDYKHVTVAMKSLAIFHAHSFILRHRNVELYEEATKVCVPLTLQTNKRYMEVLQDRLIKAISKFENTTYAELFINLKENQKMLIEAAWDSVKDTCICHGDIWKENILFKYESDKPVSACLIDYQTARVSSPAFDVLYLIASSTDALVRRAHFHDMIDIYYEQFDQVLKQAGLESQNVYSRESLESDLKVIGPACVIVANTALWLANGCQQEGIVRSKRVLTTEDEKTAAIERYKTIMKDIIDDLNGYDYILLRKYSSCFN